MPEMRAHIAGVGLKINENATWADTAVSAGTKALLDAGITYRDVGFSIAGFLSDELRIPQSSFDLFGMEGAAVSEINNNAALFTAVQCIRSGQTNCALVLGLDKMSSDNGTDAEAAAAVAVVLVSDLFLTSHAYLKDSAIWVRACTFTTPVYSRSLGKTDELRTWKKALQAGLRLARLEAFDVQVVQTRHEIDSTTQQAIGDFKVSSVQQQTSSTRGITGLVGLCSLVWELRGWNEQHFSAGVRNSLQFSTGPSGSASVLILCRSDGGEAPAWDDIKNVRDGRERLGYNPASQTRDISREDLEAVLAPEEYTSTGAVRKLQLSVKGGDRAALARL